MVTNYQAIKGWFDYADLYDSVVNHLYQKLERKIVIVEVGAWLGKSSFYLVERHSNKADIYIVDTWQGSPAERESAHLLATQKDIFIDFMKNMQVHHGKFTPVRCESTQAAKIFSDKSVDFIFIDGDHSYEAVKADIEAWQPKVTELGIIAGHDYTHSFQGVINAVNEKVGIENIRKKGRCWIYERSELLSH